MNTSRNECSLTERLAGGTPVFGPFCKMSDPTIYELIGQARFDFAIIDLEHGPMSFESAQTAVRECENSGVIPIVRVPSNADWLILRALDIAAAAVQIPGVQSASQAREAVACAKYHPIGRRGVCRYVRAAKFSAVPKEEHFVRANRDTGVIIHIEGSEGVSNLPEILRVPGIDVVFVGPYDLSQSLGVPGATNHPMVLEEMRRVVEQALDHGLVVGTFVESVEEAKMWLDRGLRYIAYSVDVGLVLDAFRRTAADLRQLLPPVKAMDVTREDEAR